MEKIAHGAEAVLFREGSKLLKERVPKGYRLAELDSKIRKLRTRSEARLLQKSATVAPVPKVLDVKETTIEMEFVEGKLLKDVLERLPNRAELFRQIGQSVAAIHKLGIVHGDLTTANMILKDNKVYLIDFGLAKHSKSVEDFAVDLHLLHEVLTATHTEIADECFENFLDGYKPSKELLTRLEVVENRGRYKKTRGRKHQEQVSQ